MKYFLLLLIFKINYSFAQNNYINDIDNNLYHLQKVGNTLWAYENLNVTHFRNGDSILEIKTQKLNLHF